jgi:hypothetical protein
MGVYLKNTPQNGTAVEKNEVDFLVQNQRSRQKCINNDWKSFN